MLRLVCTAVLYGFWSTYMVLVYSLKILTILTDTSLGYIYLYSFIGSKIALKGETYTLKLIFSKLTVFKVPLFI